MVSALPSKATDAGHADGVYPAIRRHSLHLVRSACRALKYKGNKTMPRNKNLLTLTPAHKLFCREYVGAARFNGQKAAELAGYASTNLYGTANTLLRDPLIQAELAELAAPALAKAELSINSVIKELAGIVHLSVGDYFDEDGGLIPLAELSESAKRGIRSVKVRVTASGDQIVDMQFHDKMKAIHLAMTKLGLLSEKLHEETGGRTILCNLEDLDWVTDRAKEGGDVAMIKLTPFPDVEVLRRDDALEREKFVVDKPNPDPPPEVPFDPRAHPTPTAKRKRLV